MKRTSDIQREAAKATYYCDRVIESIGARPGDYIVVRPAHPTAPLYVLRTFDRNRLPNVLSHLDEMPLVSLEDSEHRKLSPHLGRDLLTHLRRSFGFTLRLVR